MATIRPADLPAADNVPSGAAIIVDTGATVQKATPEKIVDAAAPLASEADAINGVGNNNRMSALRVKQAMDANLATTAALASTDPGKGDDLVAHADDYEETTVRNRINILSATARPAMVGIFSSGDDQRAALLDFISKSAADGKTIEWGPIDLSLDVVTQTASRRGLVVPSGSRWVMHPETRIRALPNANGSYEIINIWDAQDIVIEGNGAKIIGDRDAHTGTTGEWGMGVAIRSGTNIRISNLAVNDCWGDGFYIGRGSTPFSQDIVLDGVSGDNNRRQGLSLISAKGFRCSNYLFTNTNGAPPEWGIDIEPNNTDEFLQDVWFINGRTANNTRGFGLFLSAMIGSVNPIDIHVINCADDGSQVGFSGSIDTGLLGFVDVVDFVSRNAGGSAFVFERKRASGLKYRLVRPTAIDWNRDASTSPIFSAAIGLYAVAGNAGTDALGNLDVINPDLKLNSGDAVTAIVVSDARAGADDPQNVQIIDPVNLEGKPCSIRGVSTFTDAARKSTFNWPNANGTIGIAQTWKHYVVNSLTDHRTLTVSNGQAIGWEFVFESNNSSGHQTRIEFPEGVSLFPDALGASRRIYTTTKGSRLRIRKTAANEWMVIEKTGTWETA